MKGVYMKRISIIGGSGSGKTTLANNLADELKLPVAKVAIMLGVSRKTIYDIINCKAAITPVMALKIAKAFNSEAEFWLDLQVKYDLFNARQNTNLDNIQAFG